MGGMKQFFCFVGIGLVSTIPGELLNQLLSHRNPRAFGVTMISYTVLMVVGYFVGEAGSRGNGRPATAARNQYLLFGSLGLAVEWLLLGNAPVLDLLQPIVQPGMFTFWGTMMLAPRLLREPPAFAALQRASLRYFMTFSVLYLLVALVVPREKGGIFFGFIIFSAGYTGLNVYYRRYFRQLRAGEDSVP